MAYLIPALSTRISSVLGSEAAVIGAAHYLGLWVNRKVRCAWPPMKAAAAAGRLRANQRGGRDMKALVYHGPGQRAWESVPDPAILEPTDAIVRIDSSTICGTDLHILKGDVPEVKPGTILGHEAVGTVVEVGAAVTTHRARRPRARLLHHRRAGAAASARRPTTASAPAAAAGSSAT